jgi:ribonuclease HI
MKLKEYPNTRIDYLGLRGGKFSIPFLFILENTLIFAIHICVQQAMWITINTDASFLPDHKVGGYAVWISTSLGKIKIAHPFKGTLSSSNDAEFKAIINALYLIKPYNWELTGIVINTDSMNTIDAIKGKIPNDKDIQNNINIYNQVIEELNVKQVVLKHIKAHNNTKTPAYWVNNWLDKQAKQAAQKALKNILSD